MIRFYGTGCVTCLGVEGKLRKKGIKFVQMPLDLGMRAFFAMEGIKELPVLEIEDGVFRSGADCYTWIEEEYQPDNEESTNEEK